MSDNKLNSNCDPSLCLICKWEKECAIRDSDQEKRLRRAVDEGRLPSCDFTPVTTNGTVMPYISNQNKTSLRKCDVCIHFQTLECPYPLAPNTNSNKCHKFIFGTNTIDTLYKPIICPICGLIESPHPKENRFYCPHCESSS